MAGTEAPSFAFPNGVLAREVDGEMVLLNLNTEQYYGLDPIGADMVARLTKTSYEVVVEDLCRKYEVESEALRSDMDHLVGELIEAGLLVRKKSP